MIYEEAQGNALIRTLQIHKNSKNKKLLELQMIMVNFFEMIGTQLQQTELVWQTRKRVAELICFAASQAGNKRTETQMYWKKRS